MMTTRQTPVRIAICWPDTSGYMAACWRALAAREDVVSCVLAYTNTDSRVPFAGLDFSGVDLQRLPSDQRNDPDLLRDALADFAPDVIMLAGWAIEAHLRLAIEGMGHAKFVMTSDAPFRYSLKQVGGRFVKRKYFSKIDRMMVPGERGYQLGRVLGFKAQQIRRGVLACDFKAFSPCYDLRLQAPWPKQFVTIGRLIEVKGIRTLIEAYRRYRDAVTEPWGLTICGTGELASLCENKPGVELAGFVQPKDLPGYLTRSGAMVLAPSREAWGVAVAEACAAGLPVVCTEGTGSAPDLISDFYNGRVVATGDADAFASGMRWCHDRYDFMPEIGRRSRELAAPYSAEMWAERVASLAHELATADSHQPTRA